ncbi:hypothetical protein DPX16_7484 [Anabarilius grahami]|uniref:Uncharacterized protein n=1 Tax=Anabarilius grahami TaxID=495550 RepID=A0A3N0ZBB5_ANAGA|nr:hypothetical protein DPX16_7484 [Anabarilius grahami]
MQGAGLDVGEDGVEVEVYETLNIQYGLIIHYSRYKKSTVSSGGAVQPEAAVVRMRIRPYRGQAQQEGRLESLRVFSLYGPLRFEMWIGVGARRSVGLSDHSDWLFSYCHLLVRKGISSYAGAERTCYLAAGCLVSVWCVRPTLDTDAAEVSQPRSLLSSPLVHRCRLGVFRP